MRTDLKPHNKTAYQKVMKAFETSDRTCVCHPTGTGKSYIVAAVCEHFKKVLILAPNTFVLHQVHDVLRWRKRGVEYMTYITLMLTENPHTDYDLICLDEFHRAGAQEWGAAVDRLLKLNKKAKVLGTSATPIRYLDGERNMADELFNGNIASEMSIAEAWSRGILPIPRYVSGLFRWDKAVGDIKKRINHSQILTEEEKRQRIFRLNNAQLHWELSYGMPTILRKHLERDARRVIVFCGSIEGLDRMCREVVDWFREAGFTIAGTCIMHSDLTDREQREEMKLFESDKEDGVMLMFSVNMLNEGIHIPHVNAVLMLRTTSSRIIYMQQMGRCLTAANTGKPLVLDMVDNITTTTAIKDLQNEFDALEIPIANHEGREPRKFEVKDYTLGVKDLIEKLQPDTFRQIPFEERVVMATAFCEKHGRPPGKRDLRLERRNWLIITQYYRDRPETKALIEKYGIVRPSAEQKIQMLEDFVAKHDRKPNPKEVEMHRLWRNVICRHSDNPRVKVLRKKYGKVDIITLEEKICLMQDFTAEHGRRPLRSEKKQRRIWAEMLKDGKNDERVKCMREEYGGKFKTREENILLMIKFTDEHGRAPLHDSEPVMYHVWSKIKEFVKDDSRVKLLREKYGRYGMSQEDKIVMMQKFTAEHGRCPLYAEGDLYNKWSTMIRYDKGDPRVKEMVDKYGTETLSRERRILSIQKFVEEHGRRPMYEDGKPYRAWKYILGHYPSDPRVREMQEKYGKVERGTRSEGQDD